MWIFCTQTSHGKKGLRFLTRKEQSCHAEGLTHATSEAGCPHVAGFYNFLLGSCLLAPIYLELPLLLPVLSSTKQFHRVPFSKRWILLWGILASSISRSLEEKRRREAVPCQPAGQRCSRARRSGLISPPVLSSQGSRATDKTNLGN